MWTNSLEVASQGLFWHSSASLQNKVSQGAGIRVWFITFRRPKMELASKTFFKTIYNIFGVELTTWAWQFRAGARTESSSRHTPTSIWACNDVRTSTKTIPAGIWVMELINAARLPPAPTPFSFSTEIVLNVNAVGAWQLGLLRKWWHLAPRKLSCISSTSDFSPGTASKSHVNIGRLTWTKTRTSRWCAYLYTGNFWPIQKL